MKKLDIKQNTPEWMEVRAQYRTASEASIVLGISPWTTVNDFKLIKAGLKKTYYNAAMRRGHETEDLIRRMASEAMHRNFQEACYINGRYMASLDGIDGDVLVEIKSSRYTYEDIKNGALPEYYEAQIQQQLHCSPAMSGYLVAYHDGEIAISEPITESPDWMERIGAAWDAFDSMPVPQTPIDMSDDSHVVGLLREYSRHKQTADNAKACMDKIRDELIAIAPDNGLIAGDYKLSRSETSTISYAAAAKAAGLDLTDYTTTATRYTLSVPKNPFGEL